MGVGGALVGEYGVECYGGDYGRGGGSGVRVLRFGLDTGSFCCRGWVLGCGSCAGYTYIPWDRRASLVVLER